MKIILQSGQMQFIPDSITYYFHIIHIYRYLSIQCKNQFYIIHKHIINHLKLGNI